MVCGEYCINSSKTASYQYRVYSLYRQEFSGVAKISLTSQTCPKKHKLEARLGKGSVWLGIMFMPIFIVFWELLVRV